MTCTGCQGALRFTPIKVELEKQQSAANLAGVLAKMGKRVFILDLDMYAPGLHTYFGKSPVNDIKNTINDYISGNCEVKDLILDLTPTIKKT